MLRTVSLKVSPFFVLLVDVEGNYGVAHDHSAVVGRLWSQTCYPVACDSAVPDLCSIASELQSGTGVVASHAVDQARAAPPDLEALPRIAVGQAAL